MANNEENNFALLSDEPVIETGRPDELNFGPGAAVPSWRMKQRWERGNSVLKIKNAISQNCHPDDQFARPVRPVGLVGLVGGFLLLVLIVL